MIMLASFLTFLSFSFFAGAFLLFILILLTANKDDND